MSQRANRDESMNCQHTQCCLCLKRECQGTERFRSYGGLYVCGESCVNMAVSLAYNAACRLGGATEKPCGRGIR